MPRRMWVGLSDVGNGKGRILVHLAEASQNLKYRIGLCGFSSG